MRDRILSMEEGEGEGGGGRRVFVVGHEIF